MQCPTNQLQFSLISAHASFFKLLKHKTSFFWKPIFAEGKKTRATTTSCLFNIALLDGLFNLVLVYHFTKTLPQSLGN